MSKNILSLTNKAAKQIKLLLAERNKPSFGIRVGVKSGGCFGQTYYIEYADDWNKFDELIEIDNIRVLIDSKALMYIINSEMDYVEDKFKSGFTFNNPNAKGNCGCSKSFSV